MFRLVRAAPNAIVAMSENLMNGNKHASKWRSFARWSFFFGLGGQTPRRRAEKNMAAEHLREGLHETAPTIEQRLLAESPIVANVASVVLDVVLAAL